MQLNQELGCLALLGGGGGRHQGGKGGGRVALCSDRILMHKRLGRDFDTPSAAIAAASRGRGDAAGFGCVIGG